MRLDTWAAKVRAFKQMALKRGKSDKPNNIFLEYFQSSMLTNNQIICLNNT